MTITEFAILVFKSPPDFSDPTLQSLFQKLSDWQSECSGFPLVFFRNTNDFRQVHLVTGWKSVAAHETWIQGEWNQTLLQLFGPYVNMPKIRMVHLGVDFEEISKLGDADEWMIIERYLYSDGENAMAAPCKSERLDESTWSLFGRDLACDHGVVFRFIGGTMGPAVEGVAPVKQWVLKRVGVV